MSNRFHTKWHRRNHHTYGNSSNPDASFDPIASPAQPFLGDFSIQGAISAVAPASAYGVYIYTNNTALCAYAATRAGYFNSAGPMGIEVYDSKSRAISAFAPQIGLDIGSTIRAISAYGGTVAGEFYSPQYALSAYGGIFGASITSPIRAISAFGGVIGGEFYSPQYALSAYGGKIGINVGSPNIALSARGNNIGAVISSNTVALSTSGFSEPFPNPSQPYFGPAYVSKNVLNNRTGIFTENPLSAFHVTGGTLLDGHCTITGNLSVLRDFTYLDTYVYITSATQIVLQNNSNESPALLVSNTGENYVMQVFDGGGTTMSGASPSGYPALIVDGHSSRPGYVGLGTLLPNNPLTVVGTISGSQRLQIGYNATASGLYSSVAGGQNNTASGNYSNVAGGCANNACGNYSNVAGGCCNTASGYISNVAGGRGNNASRNFSNVAGGNFNNACGTFSNVAGGSSNNACGYSSNVAGGTFNKASGCYSNVAGGCGNTASGNYSNVAGGCCNNACGCYSNVAGGRCNTASGVYSFVAAGSSNNTNNQTNTFILGSNLIAPLSSYTYVNNISAAGYSCNQYSVTDSTFNNRITTKGNDKTLAVQNSTTVSGYVSIQNLYNGLSASTDVSIFNNNGAYVDLGINSTGYNGYLYSSVFNIASANDAYLFSNASTNNLAIGTANTSDLVFFTGGTLSGVKVAGGNEAMRIKNSGNVGINVSNPATTLSINGTLSASGNVSFGSSLTSNGNITINNGLYTNSVFTGLNGDGVIIDYIQGSPGIGRISVGNGTGADALAFYSNGPGLSTPATTLYLGNNGKVGVNSSSPQSTLSISGSLSSAGGEIVLNNIGNFSTTLGNNTANVIVNSNNFTAPNQVYTGSSSVLIGSLGDTRYTTKPLITYLASPVTTTAYTLQANATVNTTNGNNLGLALVANTAYLIRGQLLISSSGTNGFSNRLYWDTAPSYVGLGAVYGQAATSSFGTANTTNSTSTYLLGNIGSNIASNIYLVKFDGVITTGSNAVNIVAQTIQYTNGSATVSVYAGSFLEARPLV